MIDEDSFDVSNRAREATVYYVSERHLSHAAGFPILGNGKKALLRIVFTEQPDLLDMELTINSRVDGFSKSKPISNVLGFRRLDSHYKLLHVIDGEWQSNLPSRELKTISDLHGPGDSTAELSFARTERFEVAD